MLIDEWVSTTEIEIKNPGAVWGSETSPYNIQDRLAQSKFTLAAAKKAQNFVMSPLVVETASGLGRDLVAIERSAGHLFMPAETTWIDLTACHPAGGIPGARHGVLLVGKNGSIQQGEALVVAYLRRAPGHEADWGDGGFMQVGFRFDLTKGNLARPAYEHQHKFWRDNGGNIGALACTIWCTLALLNTKRLIDVRDADLSRINKARMAHKKPPILQFKMVSINIDRSDFGRSFVKHETDQRALHHVRAFLRLRRGRVELVRPHWRGNPRFGVVVHRYVALREEDEVGAWKGGPMPAARIIKELQ